MLSGLRPYRRRLILLVVLAALAGAAVGELAPARKDMASTKTSHGAAAPRGRAQH
jgi:hypothetical protein